MRPGGVNVVMHQKRARRILRDLRKVREKSSSEEEGWLSELAGALWRVRVSGGGGQMEK